MTRDQVLAMCRERVTVDIVTAGKPFGASRMTSYRLVKAGKFPVPVIHVGKKMVCTTASILAALGMTEAAEEQQAAA